MGVRPDPALEWTKLTGLQPALQLMEAALLQNVYAHKVLQFRSLRPCAKVSCFPFLHPCAPTKKLSIRDFGHLQSVTLAYAFVVAAGPTLGQGPAPCDWWAWKTAEHSAAASGVVRAWTEHFLARIMMP